METKPLLYGLIGFFIGGLLVSIAATTFEKDTLHEKSAKSTGMSMSTDGLAGKTGAAFDRAFLSEMIAHHQGAIDMAELVGRHAERDELKALSAEIIAAQEREIKHMKQWQKDWGYVIDTGSPNHIGH